MRKTLEVAAREYIETVKTRTFLLGLFLTPVLMLGIFAFSFRLTKHTVAGPRPPRTIAVTDAGGRIFPELKRLSEKNNSAKPRARVYFKLSGEKPEVLRERVRTKELDGYLFLPKDVAERGKARLILRGQDIADLALTPTVRRMVYLAVVDRRFRRNNLSPKLIAKLRRRVPTEIVEVGAKGKRKPGATARRMVPFMIMFLMFMGIFGTSQQLLTSVIEEKSNRVIEILLSSLSPFELMAGKVVGLTAVGLTLTGVWGLSAAATAFHMGLGQFVNTAGLGYFLIYFVLGFLLLASIFAAIGSVCNTLKDAQSLVLPVSMMMVVPMMAWFYIAQNPKGTAAVILSFIPPITPLVMTLRIAAYPDMPLGQIIASIVVLAASVPVVMWAAAKVFRTGILMYGKPPTPWELVRWLKSS